MKTFFTDRNPVQEPWLDQIRAGDFTGMPHPFTWEGSFAFSHLIGNAYAHWRPLGLDPPQVLLKERLADAKRTGGGGEPPSSFGSRCGTHTGSRGWTLTYLPTRIVGSWTGLRRSFGTDFR